MPPSVIGRISIPAVTPTALFPLRTDFAHGRSLKRNVVVHLVGDASGKVEQRFYTGPSAPRYTFLRHALKLSDRKLLAAFWETMLGPTYPFYYDVPLANQSFTRIVGYFENAPLSLEDLADHICSVGLTIVEVPDPTLAPVYDIAASVTRFPDGSLEDALLDQVQELIPLVRIRVAEAAVPDIYLSDRLVTVGDFTYQPRVLGIGDSDTGVLVSQGIDGSADDVSFSFGNADRIMVKLANDTDLFDAKIELSLFHVGTRVKLDLWAGRIIDWSSNKREEFKVQASDIISALTLQSPVRNISRSCWRIVGDISTGCPAAPGSTCDLTMDGPDGCKAKGGTVKLSYGGISIRPQSVTIKDNSTGTWGYGRDLVTPTSQINDTIYGGTLPEIWHDDDGIPQRGLSVECRMADGREESEFYEGLGIMGRGPIGAWTTARMYDSDGDGKAETFLGSTLDGQPHHGFTQTDANGAYTDSNLGLRQINGTDPAGANDFLSLDRLAGTPLAGEVQVGPSIFLDNFAAGVAFLVIRRTDQKGIQPSDIKSHQMTAMISKGLTGLGWSGPGSRHDILACTNPFWVAVNTLLRSLGVDTLDAATQEQYFDVLSAIQCAAVADTSVSSLVGGGSELQFRFKGTIDTRKSLRDRLVEILNNCLGYYTWQFGKLKLGVRTSAVPETNFSPGNMLFGSLILEPIKPEFEKLTVEFADTEFLFAKNTVDYTDQDYAHRHGRIQNPKTKQIGLIGASRKSEAGRIAVIRTREELGGVGLTEQTNARVASFKTTVLGLGTQAGQVIGIYDTDIPLGANAFRIQHWQLNRDWSLEIKAQSVTTAMYDLASGSVAVDVTVPGQPTNADTDQGPPPAPLFSGRVSISDSLAAEVYNLHFASTVNTRTITQGTFTFTYHDPTVGGDPDKTKTVSTTFPYDFFLITPPATTYQEAALDWVLKTQLPGMNVTQICGFVTNLYGDSPTTCITVNLQLAGLPKSIEDDNTQYLSAYTASTGTFTIRHFDDGEVPAGAMNGTNPVFTLAAAPDPPDSLQLKYNGIDEVEGVEFNLTGNTITYTRTVNLPDESKGDRLRAFYRQ